MALVDIDNLFELDLTPEYLLGLTTPVQPCVCGDDIAWRFQVLDALGVAMDLSTATAIRMTIRQFESDAAPLLTRDLDVVISGSVKEIERDVDQTAQTVDADGDVTGRGCFTVRWHRLDEAKLIAIVGKACVYDIRLRLAGSVPRTFCRGRFRAMRAITTNTELP